MHVAQRHVIFWSMPDVSQKSNLVSSCWRELEIHFYGMSEAFVSWHQGEGQKWIYVDKCWEEARFCDEVFCRKPRLNKI